MLSDRPQDGIYPLGCQGSLVAHSTPEAWEQSEGLLSHLSLCPAFLHSRCRIQRYDLLSFIPLVTAQCTNQTRSLYKASSPLRQSTSPLSLALSASLLMVHSTPTSRSLISVLNRTDCGIVSQLNSPPARFSPIHYNSSCSALHPVLLQSTMNQKDSVRNSLKILPEI